MISRASLISRRLFSTNRFIPFNLKKSFEYLTKSEKYRDLSPAVTPDLTPYKNEIYRGVQSSQFDSLKFDLDLPSRLALCDQLQNELFHLTNPVAAAAEEDEDELKSFSPDQFKFKDFLQSFLRTNLQKTIATPEGRANLLNSLSPKFYLKLLYYYARFHSSGHLTRNEIEFLQSYPNSAAGALYDYDIHELATLSHCFYKLNLQLDRSFCGRYLSTFCRLNKNDQLTFFYPAVKMVRQQLYFDAEFLELTKTMLRDSHRLLPYNAAVNVAAALAGLGHYDQELLKVIAQIVGQVANLRFKDITKCIWAFSFLGYDLRRNRQLLTSLIGQIKALKKQTLLYESGVQDSIDLIKSLIYLNIYDFELIDLFLNDRSINAVVGKSRLKDRKDLFFILKSLEIEYPHFTLANRSLYRLALPPAQSLQKELQARPDYPNFIDFYRSSLPTADQFRYKVVYPLPHLNLSSILVGHLKNGRETSFLLELLDGSNTFPGQPVRMKGVYQTKLRQMNAMGLDFVLFRKLSNGNFVKLNCRD